MSDDESDASAAPPSGDAAQWALFALAGLILLGVVAALSAAAFGPRQPPQFTAAVVSVEQRDTHYYVNVAVENTGDVTAADLDVSATVHGEGAVVAQESETLDFLAGGERKQVTFVFDREVGAQDVRVAVGSFRRP